MKKQHIILRCALLTLLFSCNSRKINTLPELILLNGHSWEYNLTTGNYTTKFIDGSTKNLDLKLSDENYQEIMDMWLTITNGMKDSLYEFDEKCLTQPKIYSTLFFKQGDRHLKISINRTCDSFFSMQNEAIKFKSLINKINQVLATHPNHKNVVTSDFLYQ